ncbi:MAG: hypothetical protein KDC85_10000 [Saprospiraceae bacterium]|nr:hypothetical protein [Saprospiraceae bacterium]
MSKVSNFLMIIFLSIIFTHCTNENKAQLLGEWQGLSWVVEGQQSSRNAEAVQFSFLENGEYSGSWGDKTEKGVFSLDADKLYTTEEGKLKKMVKIEFTGSDTLVFHMNRMGTEEQLILVRK